MKRTKCDWEDRAAEAVLANLKGFADKSVRSDDRAPERITPGSRRQATWTRPHWLDPKSDASEDEPRPA